MRRFLTLVFTVALAVAIAPEARADHKGKVPWLEPTEGFQKARMTGQADHALLHGRLVRSLQAAGSRCIL